ncbi:MAG: hypothetical protein RQ885_12685 [Desulfurococcales archaeon]|jgi:hypothetical protein|nr:hypothetical protein [Desulfurococcales archaeon]
MMLKLVNSYFNGLSRILVLEGGSTRLYIIDHYQLLPKHPSLERCTRVLEVGASKLCYMDLEGRCQLLILIIDGRAEIISVRLITTTEKDPAEGSPKRAKEYCLASLSNVLNKEL